MGLKLHSWIQETSKNRSYTFSYRLYLRPEIIRIKSTSMLHPKVARIMSILRPVTPKLWQNDILWSDSGKLNSIGRPCAISYYILYGILTQFPICQTIFPTFCIKGKLESFVAPSMIFSGIAWNSKCRWKHCGEKIAYAQRKRQLGAICCIIG